MTAPFIEKLIAAASADETTSKPVYCTPHVYLTAVLQGNGTTSSGVLTIEQAAWLKDTESPYGGTWSPITTLNASDVTGDQQKGYQFTVAAYGWVRFRLSTAVGGGGTVTAYLVGSGR